VGQLQHPEQTLVGAQVVDNDFIKGLIEECQADKVSVKQFPGILLETLTAGITYARGDRPDLIAILDNPEQLKAIVEAYAEIVNGG
jgi:uncharacterized protein (DUF169 family)